MDQLQSVKQGWDEANFEPSRDPLELRAVELYLALCGLGLEGEPEERFKVLEQVKFKGAAQIMAALPEVKLMATEALQAPVPGHFRRAKAQDKLTQFLLLAERVTPITILAEQLYQALVATPRAMLIYDDASDLSLREATRFVARLALLRVDVFEAPLKQGPLELFLEEAFQLLRHEDYRYLVELADISIASVDEQVSYLRDRVEATLILEEEA